jgi:ATP-dependent RNA helicase DHX8/PRP22
VYVIDPGMVKQKEYDPQTGMDALKVGRISQTQATQRSGRAGRTQAGRCFRLYPKLTFEREMPHAQKPEILRSSLLGIVLHLKSLAIALDILTFDFLDPPAPGARVSGRS